MSRETSQTRRAGGPQDRVGERWSNTQTDKSAALQDIKVTGQ